MIPHRTPEAKDIQPVGELVILSLSALSAVAVMFEETAVAVLGEADPDGDAEAPVEIAAEETGLLSLILPRAMLIDGLITPVLLAALRYHGAPNMSGILESFQPFDTIRGQARIKP